MEKSITAAARAAMEELLAVAHLAENDLVVVVPLRLPTQTIGHAPLVAARTRPRFVGGTRAVYDENLL